MQVSLSWLRNQNKFSSKSKDTKAWTKGCHVTPAEGWVRGWGGGMGEGELIILFKLQSSCKPKVKIVMGHAASLIGSREATPLELHGLHTEERFLHAMHALH